MLRRQWQRTALGVAYYYYAYQEGICQQNQQHLLLLLLLLAVVPNLNDLTHMSFFCLFIRIRTAALVYSRYDHEVVVLAY